MEKYFLVEFVVRIFVTNLTFAGTIGHSGYFCCTYCHQIGIYIERRVASDIEVGDPRTDEEFRTYSDKNHHIRPTPLVNCPLVNDMIWSFPIDCMHSLDLGFTKKLLVLLILGGYIDIRKAQEIIDQLKPYVPTDFARKPRHIDMIKFFKATEYRLIGLYIGPIILMKCCNDGKLVKHFLKYFVSYRLLLGENGQVEEQNRKLAEVLNREVVKEFAELYGREKVSFNVHSLLHLHKFVELYGSLDRFSAYRFENFYQLLRKWVRSADNCFLQICSRWFQCQGRVRKKAVVKRKFGSYILKANKKDSCVMLNDGSIQLITGVLLPHTTFKSKCYNTRRDFFLEPVRSSEMNIFLVSDINEIEETINIDNIKRKMFCMPWNVNHFVVMPIIHYEI